MIIYFDMDGVLCDFDFRCSELDCWKPENHKPDWNKMEEIGSSFWSEMKPIQHGLDLINEVHEKGYKVGIFSAIHLPCGKYGKKIWLKKYLPFIDDIIIVNNGAYKHKCAPKDTMLVDDRIINVDNYISVGNKAIQYTNDLTSEDIINMANS